MSHKLAAFLGLCLIASRLSAVAPHPTVLTVRYDKGEVRAVVKVRGDTPYVLSEGKIREVRWQPKYILQRADNFSDNKIECLEGPLWGKTHVKGAGWWNTGVPSLRTYIEASLRAEKTIKRGFAVLVSFFTNLDRRPTLSITTVNVHDLPELPAGQAVKVKFSFAGGPVPGSSYFIQIFDDEGMEVMANGADFAWQYYAARDLDRLSATVGDYLKANQGDHDATPFVMPKPLFKSGTVLPKSDTSALLSVTESGQVSAVEVRGVDDAEVRAAIVTALEGWLFLPKLKAGQPVPVKVAIPLQF